MSIDMDTLSAFLDEADADELLAVAEIANQKHEAIKTSKLLETVEQIHALAASVGMTLEEVVSKRAAEKPKPDRAPVPVKYRNPDNPDETWTGRGKRPNWLRDAIDAGGYVLEDFAVEVSA
mgnify:FL=1